MFTKACQIYWSLKCHVGVGARSRGLGCRLSARHILTARHVYEGAEAPTALIGSGVWRCSIHGEWADADLGVLQTEELLKPADLHEPATFPDLHSAMPGLGQSLGYLAWLTTDHSVTYFGHGYVAFFEPKGSDNVLFALGGTMIQRGFSGGPVFTPGGQLIGILVQCFQFVADLEHPTLVSVPLFSPVAPIAEELRQIASS